MATIQTVLETRTALTVSGLAALASGTYTVSNTLSLTASGKTALDVVLELACATTSTPTFNQQVLVFAQASYDGGTTWQSGPTTGTTRADEFDLTFIGSLPMRSATTTHRKPFSVAEAYGGVCPPDVRFVFFNDLGVALTSATAHTRRVVGDTV